MRNIISEFFKNSKTYGLDCSLENHRHEDETFHDAYINWRVHFAFRFLNAVSTSEGVVFLPVRKRPQLFWSLSTFNTIFCSWVITKTCGSQTHKPTDALVRPSSYVVITKKKKKYTRRTGFFKNFSLCRLFRKFFLKIHLKIGLRVHPRASKPDLKINFLRKIFVLKKTWNFRVFFWKKVIFLEKS